MITDEHKDVNEELLKQTMLAIEENIFDVEFVDMLLNNYRQAKLTEKLFMSVSKNEQNDIIFDSSALRALHSSMRVSKH